MSWPTMTDYQEAIQNPRFCFGDPELQQGSPVLNSLGLPKPITGAFASVYQLQCGGGKQYAVRCFLRYHPDQEQRYAAISDYLRHAQLPYMVTFNLLNQGIRVQGQWYPILKMEWLDGLPLNAYIEQNLHNPARLRDLAEHFRELMTQLGQASIAHGDLQHGNILIVNHAFRLIDYDGMFVPGLRGMGSHELGHRNYQHPRRVEADFGPYIDNFSAWVIYLSLKALSAQPGLWRDLDAGDECLLLRDTDFAHADTSPALRALEQVPDPDVKALVGDLRAALNTNLAAIPSLNGTVGPPPSRMGAARRAIASWLDDYITPPGAEEAIPLSARPDAYSTADWVLDYIERTPDPEPATAPAPATITERYVISAFVLLAYLAGVAALLGVVAPLAAFGAAGSGALVVLGFLAVQYGRFPEVMEKRGLLGRDLWLRWQIVRLEHHALRFAADRQRLAETEAATLALLNDVISQAIEQELANYPLSRRDVPDLGIRLEMRLRLSGVRTAADVVESRLTTINGLDQRRIDSLIAWRKRLEQQVRTQLAPSFDAWQLARQSAIRQEFGQKRGFLDGDEAQYRAMLTQKNAELADVRRSLARYADVTFTEYLRWIF